MGPQQKKLCEAPVSLLKCAKFLPKKCQEQIAWKEIIGESLLGWVAHGRQKMPELSGRRGI